MVPTLGPMSESNPVEWDRFTHDPRQSAYAALRASDLDRSVALDAVSAAFADGRLDREEYDGRSDQVQASKTLGELVGPLRDLAPEQAGRDLVRSGSKQVEQRAQEKYVQTRQNAFGTFLVPSLICWVVWLATTPGTAGWWPIWVTLGTSVRLIQVLVNKQAIIASERRRIERKELRAIEEKPN